MLVVVALVMIVVMSLLDDSYAMDSKMYNFLTLVYESEDVVYFFEDECLKEMDFMSYNCGNQKKKG